MNAARAKLAALSLLVCLAAEPLTVRTGAASAAAPDGVQQQIEKITGCLTPAVVVRDEARSCTTLSARMEQLHVPGVSIAVIRNGSIAWARGYGVKRAGGAPVTAGTLFQAGSISKPLAAMAALRQVQEKKLALDADVNSELVSWKVPESAAAHGKVVTLRELLTHTAGFTVHGFPGYAAGARVPTLIEVLDGRSPANTPPIRLESEPGSRWNYSGGGYTVMQQTVLDATQTPFPALLHDTVLAPIGMAHSTNEQPLPAAMESEAATPYDEKGRPIRGGSHTYPEMAAAGLWTTPSDLALFCLETQRSLEGKANHVLSEELTREMVTPGKGSWGLGLQIGGAPGDPYFTHGGVNEGFESVFVAYEHHADGAVVMTNAQGGTRLAGEILRSIAAEYDWPDFKPVVHSAVNVDRAVLARYAGTYELAPGFSILVTLEGDRLFAQATDQSKLALFPESQTKFFLKAIDAQVEFFPGAQGQVPYMILHQGGQDAKGMKK